MAISSKTDVCNLSLDLLNASVVLDVDTPTTPTEELMYRWYDQSRREALRGHPWNFASKRVTLAASSTAPEYGYSHAFPMRSDFIRLLTVHDSEGNIIPSSDYEFENGNILYDSDDGILRIRYVYDFKDIPNMDPMFINLVAHKIAIGTGFKIDGSNTTIERVEALRKNLESIAKSIDGQERPPTRVQRSVNKQSRKGSTRTDRIVF